MGRSYAGILGLLAFATVVARGVVHGSSVSSTCGIAAALLFVFAAIGYVVGSIAQTVVSDALKARFTAELAKLQTSPGDVQK